VTSLRVVVVAGDPLARAGLVAVLEDQPGVEIVGQGASADAVSGALSDADPDVILWDIGPAGAEGLDPPAAPDAPATPLVALVSAPADAGAALAAGARGVLPRDTPPEVLGVALQAAAAGLVVSEPSLTSGLLPERDREAVPPVEDLTPREREVLQLLAEGLTNKHIARRLGTSEHTVKFHVNAILGKLDAHSRTEAVTRAARLGLIIL
jgi:two-component system nitrate/nitrite response regulator NarL